jgi:CheY-like chemotaxis protein
MHALPKLRPAHTRHKAPQPSDQLQPDNGQPIRILIVEDEAIPAMLLEEMVEDLGFTVCGKAVSGPGAVMAAEDYRPDLILMDIRLAQGTDGIDAAVEIRERLGIPSLFMSAFSDKGIMARAQAAQPVGFVGKPYDETRLRIALEAALKTLGEGRG